MGRTDKHKLSLLKMIIAVVWWWWDWDLNSGPRALPLESPLQHFWF
jgi:hypothetical protein